MKICLIGCGFMAVTGHGPALRKYAGQHPGVVLAGCCDVDAGKAEEFRRTFGFAAAYTDMRRMLDAERPDAVCLAVPEKLTAQLSIEIMQNGYPLLMEKPPGLTRAETLRMISAAAESRMPNQVAFNRRFMPLNALLKQKISGLDVQNIRCDFYRENRPDADFATTAIHGIDNTRFLAGSDYRQIHFFYQELPQYGPGVANIFMQCTFAAGMTAQLNFCPMAGAILERITVAAEGHMFFAHLPVWGAADAPGELLHMENGEICETISGRALVASDEVFETNGFYAENESFLNNLRSGKAPQDDIRSGLQAVEIADCIRMRQAHYAAE